ncbi:MAG: ATP-binding protein, partial [Acidobacteria bacterium]|nr:ATP-binding protein [Acidobacteriota bacterium]
MTTRIFAKLIFAVLLVLVVALVGVDFLASRVAEKPYLETLTRALTDRARMVKTLRAQRAISFAEADVRLLARGAGARVTVIDRTGRVLADSDAVPERMENHASRQEVRTALLGQEGWIKRRSPTLGLDFLYVAIPIAEGALRLAVPLSEIDRHVDVIRQRMLVATAIAFFPAIILAALFARQASSRLSLIIGYAAELAKGNFQARLGWTGRDELNLLGRKLDETGEKLQKMFQELQHERAELEKLERIRKDFVINVSHELRTPLASIQGYTETLLDGALDDPAHNVRFLSIIRQNTERLARLTADLLTLSRIELRRQRFQFASYYVQRMLDDAVDSLRPMADKKRIALIVEPVAPDTEVFCDAEAVYQVLSNLIDNALKYTPEGKEIHIGACPIVESGQEMVEFFVRDTGIGIPETDLTRLFERFYRVDKARSRE